MKLLIWLRLLLRDAFKRTRFESQMNDEIRFHLESRAENLIQSGVSRPEAERRARLEFGGLDAYKDDCRQARGLRLFDELHSDLRLALRQMRRTPGFTVTAVLILAIGIGANTTIFSLVDAVLLKMLPVRNPAELRQLEWVARRGNFVHSYDGSTQNNPAGERVATSFSYIAYQYLRDHSTSMGLFCFGGSSNLLNLSVRGHAELATGTVVSGNFFSVLGVEPLLGRTITSEDDQAGAVTPVAVLSYGFWQRVFGGDPAAVGQTVAVNGVSFVIIGVTPRGFHGVSPGNSMDVMLPISMQPVAYATPNVLQDPRSWWFRVMGRLRPGASEVQAQAESEFLLHQAILADPPDEEYDVPRLALTPGGQGIEGLRDELRHPLLILMSVAGVVLLIVCANIGGLLLTRAAARRREIGTRLALGAGRARLIRQLLTESFLLAGLGGAAGIVLAYALRDLAPQWLGGGSTPLVLDTNLDLRMLAFSLGACLLAGLVFGLAPALRSTRVDLLPMLKQAASRSTGSASQLRAGRALVVVQVSLSLVLLVGAGFFVRTLINLRSQAFGFRPENLLTFQLDATLNEYKDERLLNLYEEVLRGIEGVPGVRSASVSRWGILSGAGTNTSIAVPGFQPQNERDNSVYVHYVAPKFFETMGIPVLAGRDVEWRDREGMQPVAVVNEAFAKHFFEGAGPVGRVFKLDGVDSKEQTEIIGLAGDTKFDSIRQAAPATIYLPFRQHEQRSMTFVARAVGEPKALVAALRRVVEGIDANLPLFQIRTQVEQINQAMGRERLFANLLVSFGLLALFLACLGLYGTLAYSVSGRIPEIGLRVALGAQRWDVTRMILKESLAPVGFGLAIGLVTALLATRLIESMLFGVKPNDPLTLAAALLVLLASAAIAAWLPARKAARVDPMIALRYE